MKKIYLVLEDGGSYVGRAFSTREKAEEYIKSFGDSVLEDGETWEDYFGYDICEVEYGIMCVDFEE